MENLSNSYILRAEFVLVLSALFYFLMNGAQIFETFIFVPKWASNPPETFHFLADKNGLSLKVFWIIVHSLHEITFILAIILCWKIPSVRFWLIALFIAHLGVRTWTLTYFAPHIIAFQNSFEENKLIPNVLEKVKMWQNLNYLRVGIYAVLSIGFIPLILSLMNLKKF